MRKKLIRFLWISMASVVVILMAAFIAIWNGWIGYMPDMEELENPISRSASMIYSADGKLMGTYNSDRENRIIVDYNKLSPDLVRALVATEDERFYEHSGIDFKALGRA
nr:transglycosylase domain-containing protein [Prevotella sp.]